MSEVHDAPTGAPSQPPDIFEQKLFELSPVGALPTAIGIFLVLLGSFEAIAFASHYPLAEQLTLSPQEGAWPAAILSLLIAVALGMQRYARLKDMEDNAALMRILPCGVAGVMAVDGRARRTLRLAGPLGAILGASISFFSVPANVRSGHPAIFLWFFCVMAFLAALFLRGALMSRISARNFSDRVDRFLKIDLLRIDELSVLGRGSARAALIWLSVAAVVCLFFASGHTPALIVAIIAFSAGMALWIFFGSLRKVHVRIVAAKRLELDRVRQEIAEARQQVSHDHTAAVRLHGLIAYETRIEAVHEWPFDHSTLLRVGAYMLVPALPSLGQFAMRTFMGHVGT